MNGRESFKAGAAFRVIDRRRAGGGALRSSDEEDEVETVHFLQEVR